MTTPVVLVTSDFRVFDQGRWHATPVQYVEAALVGAGAMPVILPPMVKDGLDLDVLLDRVDGVLLTGSRSNVYPTLYGVEPAPQYEPYDHARDATTLPLIRKALTRGMPLFAICRGFQELNVALGGTLLTEVQELDGRMDHRAPEHPEPDHRYGIRHGVRIVREGCIGRVLGDEEIQVNSLHRQAVGTLAPGLVVEATAPDGTIEAVRVEAARGFAVGVQWHPEYWVKSDAPSARLFEAFGAAMRAFSSDRGAASKAAAAE